MKAELVPDNGAPPIPISKDLTVVGRRGYCDVVVDDPSISKRHCVLVKTDGLLVIRDLGSTNGTKVKGQRIRWAALLPDDRISLGSCKFRVYLGPDDTPGPSELAEIRKARALANSIPAAELSTMIANDPLYPKGLHGNPVETSSSNAQHSPFHSNSQDSSRDPNLEDDQDFGNAKTPVDGQDVILEID
jgi:predicted component of type VI protein secretion system